MNENEQNEAHNVDKRTTDKIDNENSNKELSYKESTYKEVSPDERLALKNGAIEDSSDNQEPISIVSRIVDVMIAPKRAMENAGDTPIVLGLLVILAIASMLIYIPQRPMFLKMTMTAIENSKQTLSSAEVDLLLKGGANAAMFMSMFYLIATPLFKGVVAFAISVLLGGKGKVKSCISVVLNAYMIMVFGQVLRMVIVLATGNPYFSFSPAMFLPMGQETTALFSLLSALDLFVVWYLAVSMMGIQRVQKLSTLKAFVAVFGPWLMMLAFGFVGVGGM